MGTGDISLGVKRMGHLPPSSDEAKNMWSYTSTPPRVMAEWFIKHGENI
jgi:hypothetical protein